MIKSIHIILGVALTLNISRNLAAQTDFNKIEEFYKTQDSIGLERYLKLWYHPNSDSLEKINDTLYAVYQIHKSIIIYDRYFRGHRSKNEFFFLQANYPDVSFNNSKVKMPTSPFYNYFLSCDTIRPLESNQFWFQEIKTFLGTDPTTIEKPYMNSYLKDRRPNRNEIHKRAFNEIQEYRNRQNFLHKLVDICYTWGHISSDYTQLTVSSIWFENDLSTARVTWSCCAYGGTYLYEYKKGAWVRTKTFMERID
jgi:hypothetical protein